ncbi:MAG: hypothetical protein HY647_06950 [Acidobacteria bacterium]|nr:hypothetical protein [Acidobacteriota bacterium]
MERVMQPEASGRNEPAKSARARKNRRICPVCKHARVFRSRRRTFYDYFLSLCGLRPYRCHECEHRFHAWRVRRERPKRARWAQCPRCQSTELVRIARHKVPPTWRNLPWRIWPASAYRCPECRRRFYDFRPQDPKAAK